MVLTTATLSPDGQSHILNGRKMWITNGTITGKETGDYFLVYAKTDPTNKKNGGLTSFIVETDMPGFTLGQRIKDKCGNRASMNAELVFDDVHVPLANSGGSW